jgi:ribosomal protein S18 acetylase RimI-like enzyme
MLADLTTLPATPPPALPEGYTLSTWEGLADAEILAVHNRSFVDLPGWTPWDAPMWETWVSGSRAFRPALSLLARDGAGAVAAYVQTNEYDAVAEATGVREAYVVKVGVSPEHRRLGLASTLLGTALARFREEGFGRAGLDVDSENPTGALAIYERVGFVVQRRWTSYLLES